MNHLKFAAQCLDDSIDEQHKKKTVGAGKVIFTPDQLAQHAQAAAAIAIAAEIRNLNAILHNVTDLNGAVKVALPHPVEQALVAIAEQRPQFVQVGRTTINLRNVASMRFQDEPPFEFEGECGPCVIIWYNVQNSVDQETFQDTLTGAEATAFLAWWAEYADVVRLEVGE